MRKSYSHCSSGLHPDTRGRSKNDVAWFDDLGFRIDSIRHSYWHVVVQVHKTREAVLAMVKESGEQQAVKSFREIVRCHLKISAIVVVAILAKLYPPTRVLVLIIVLIVVGVIVPAIETGFWLRFRR